MKRILFFMLAVCLASCSTVRPKPAGEWRLTWEDDFTEENFINPAVWSKIPRGTPDWKNYMSDYDGLYDVKDGNLILRGIVNPGIEGDTATFLTGGLYTKDKKAFEGGKIEVRARFQDARGAWPAFWLLPFDNTQWPNGGEIDIMERLNGDAFVYQTVHSHYTHVLKKKTPPPGSTGAIRQGEYNVYGVELYADSVVLRTNGTRTLTYPRVPSAQVEGQFPFDRAFYLLLDMQLGGSWVGRVNAADLPVEMHIDWVRFYKKK